MSDLTIRELHKRFASHRVLTGLDLEVKAGSLTAMLGPSGSGKTTLLRLLAGFEAPDYGTVMVGGRVIEGRDTHVHPEHRRIGYVPQEGALFPHLTVKANVAFGLPRKTRRQGVDDLLELVGLADLARRYPHQLSGGQQQRVALARALATRPEIVLLDEPFASLDAHLRASVREEVSRILRNSQATTLLVTHDQDEALSLADQVAVLRDGRIAQCAAPQELYGWPVDPRLASFVGEANLVSGVAEGDLVETTLGRLPFAWRQAPASMPCVVHVLIRPEQIELHRANGQERPTGRIIGAGYHGHDSVIHVQTSPEQRGQLLIVRILGDSRLPTGTEVTLSVRDKVLAWPAD